MISPHPRPRRTPSGSRHRGAAGAGDASAEAGALEGLRSAARGVGEELGADFAQLAARGVLDATVTATGTGGGESNEEDN